MRRQRRRRQEASRIMTIPIVTCTAATTKIKMCTCAVVWVGQKGCKVKLRTMCRPSAAGAVSGCCCCNGGAVSHGAANLVQSSDGDQLGLALATLAVGDLDHACSRPGGRQAGRVRRLPRRAGCMIRTLPSQPSQHTRQPEDWQGSTAVQQSASKTTAFLTITLQLQRALGRLRLRRVRRLLKVV